jgi:hypothetical protein
MSNYVSKNTAKTVYNLGWTNGGSSILGFGFSGRIGKVLMFTEVWLYDDTVIFFLCPTA